MDCTLGTGSVEGNLFAVMASFTNLALALSSLGAKYLNQIYTVTREMKDATTVAIEVAADYSELGPQLITVIMTSCLVPFALIFFTRKTRWRSA
jgi:hypothetical protein